MENLVAADELDPLEMIAAMENLVALGEPEQVENLVAADESNPLAMIAEMENLVAVDDPEQMENLVAADDQQITNSDIDDVYQAFSNQVNSK